MASYSPKLAGKKYNNWVKAQLALLFTKEGLEPFVCHEVQEFQLKCLDRICYNNGLISGTLCSNCCTENVIICPTNRICNVRRGQCSYHRNAATRYNPAGCPNKICHNFTTEIQNAHRFYGPSYKNTDATQWCSYFWEVAKCFMPPDGYKDKASATETDFNGIISIILNYKDFQMKIHENLNNKKNMFEEAREIGRNVRLSSTLEVEDSDLQKYFNVLQKLLSDPIYLASDTHAQNAKKKLIELENDTLTLAKNDLRQALGDDAKAIQDEMKAGLDEQYDRIKLDMIKRKQEYLQSLPSQLDEELTQLKDKSDASVKRLNEERDKAGVKIHKQEDKIQTDLAELGETLHKKLKTTNEDEKEKENIDSKQTTGHSSLIPLEILRMDKHSIELYKRALSEGKEAVYNIRVMVVGHYGVGKTTLTKRLLDEDVDINKRESTNGIDVHVKRCKVSLETGQWETVAKDQKVGTVCNRLLNLLKKPLTTEKEVVVMENESTVGAVNEEFEVVDEDTSIESNSQDITEKNEGAEVVCTEPEPKMKVTLTPLEVENVTYENFQPLQDTKEENILYHLKALIEEVQHSGSTDNLNMADVSIWDFAGQFVFYATHQVFLSRRAVYLLVTDVSKSMEDMVKDDECFQDSIGVKHWKISEFVNFWLNSIQEFCDSPEDGGPPVLLVGTFADKIEQESKQRAIEDFFYTLRESLVDKVTLSHLKEKDFAIDNTIKDGNIDLLKQQIVKSASAQSYWGELIPAKWITLENSIASLKNTGSKVLHIDMLRRLNNALPVPIETDDELKLFLRFHHESGNILYYSDDNLDDTVVLDPQWLIDAFKSLITARMFCCRKPNIFKKWIQFDKTAILTLELIDAIWEQKENIVFYEHRDLLLNYLEKLGIIAKPHQLPRVTNETDYYFVPCVLKTKPPDDLLIQKESTDRRSTSKLCLTTKLQFLPTAVFNKLLAACINRLALPESGAKHLIFCGYAVLDLEGNHTIHLYFFDHVIQIWITKFSSQKEEPSHRLCSQVYAFVLDILANGLHLSDHLKVFFKCQSSRHNSNENMFPEERLSKGTEVVCNCKSEKHVLQSNELTNYWHYAEEDTPEEMLTDKQFSRIARKIGKEYQMFALELGLSQAEIDQIDIDYKYSADRITHILIRWRDENKKEATLDTLEKAMKAVGIDSRTALERAECL